MTIPINKLNLASNSKFLSKSRLTSLDHLQKWGLSINSSLSSIQKEWNNTFYPLVSTLPQVSGVNAWINGFDGEALYVNREANSSDNWFYNHVEGRPKSIKELMEENFTNINNVEKEIERYKRKIQSLYSQLTEIETLMGDVTGAAESNTVEKIQGYTLASDTPADGEALVWNESSESWEPSEVSEVPASLVYPPGYITGLNLTYTDVDQVTVSTGLCKSDDTTTDIELSSDTLMDIDNDLDTGIESTDEWYYIWIFYNPTTELTSLKFSLQYPGSGADPTAPAGYTKKRYLGSVKNTSGDFLRFSQTMDKTERNYQFDDFFTILSSGTETDWTVCSYSGATAADYTPPTAMRQNIIVRQLSGGDRVVYARGKNTILGSFYAYGMLMCLSGEIPVGDDQEIEYKVSSASGPGSIYINGYIESL